MPLQLTSVQDYIDDVRVLLLDRTQPYRYTDVQLLAALNIALMEVRRVRADLIRKNDIPYYTIVSDEPVPLEPQFRMAVAYLLAAHALQKDEEDVQDVRANTFMQMGHDMLLGPRPGPLQGGSPGPGNPQK